MINLWCIQGWYGVNKDCPKASHGQAICSKEKHGDKRNCLHTVDTSEIDTNMTGWKTEHEWRRILLFKMVIFRYHVGFNRVCVYWKLKACFFWSKLILWTVHMTIHATIITSQHVLLQFPSTIKNSQTKKDPQLFQNFLGEFPGIPWTKIIHPHLDPSQSQGM